MTIISNDIYIIDGGHTCEIRSLLIYIHFFFVLQLVPKTWLQLEIFLNRYTFNVRRALFKTNVHDSGLQSTAVISRHEYRISGLVVCGTDRRGVIVGKEDGAAFVRCARTRARKRSQKSKSFFCTYRARFDYLMRRSRRVSITKYYYLLHIILCYSDRNVKPIQHSPIDNTY